MADTSGMSTYLLKISLRGTQNLIWRRFVVPSFTTLNRLHPIVQAIMGWEGKFSHVYRLRKQEYFPADYGEFDGFPEEMYSLDDLVFRTGARLCYIHDPAGDRWIHDILLENTRFLEQPVPQSVYCLEGVRACPPESCGGSDGFRDLLKAVRNPETPEQEEIKHRYGMIDFERFDREKVNKVLAENVVTMYCPAPVVRMPDTPPTEKKAKPIPPDPLQRLGRKLRNIKAS